MNVIQYNQLINEPFSINGFKTLDLKKVIDEFPYFQSARALQLKGLFNQDSFLYNQQLKTTAAHTTDRSILFDFITSNTFISIQKGHYEQKIATLNNLDIIDLEIVESFESKLNNSLEKSILKSITEATESTNSDLVETNLEIGKPIDFIKNEWHSFQEWLELSRIEPIQRAENIGKNINFIEIESEKQKKIDLINQFIENNPKIPTLDKNSVNTTVFVPKHEDDSYLMTETLAKVYLEQKKYLKAIQAYEILILKYPEKFSFFANRISDIKILQQNNN